MNTVTYTRGEVVALSEKYCEMLYAFNCVHHYRGKVEKEKSEGIFTVFNSSAFQLSFYIKVALLYVGQIYSMFHNKGDGGIEQEMSTTEDERRIYYQRMRGWAAHIVDEEREFLLRQEYMTKTDALSRQVKDLYKVGIHISRLVKMVGGEVEEEFLKSLSTAVLTNPGV